MVRPSFDNALTNRCESLCKIWILQIYLFIVHIAHTFRLQTDQTCTFTMCFMSISFMLYFNRIGWEHLQRTMIEWCRLLLVSPNSEYLMKRCVHAAVIESTIDEPNYKQYLFFIIRVGRCHYIQPFSMLLSLVRRPFCIVWYFTKTKT